MYTHLPPADRWFLDHGLPAFIRHRSGLQELLGRIAPLAVFLVAAQSAALASSAIMAALLRSPAFQRLKLREIGQDLMAAEGAVHDFYALATLVVPGVGLACAVVVSWLISRCSPRWRLWAGATACVLFIIGPLGARLGVDFTGVFSSAPERLLLWLGVRVAIVGIMLLLVRLGIGAVLATGWRYALREVGPMIPTAAKALPLTILSFLFAFFSAETWQVASTLSGGRLAAVVLTLIALSVALLARLLHERVEQIVSAGVHPQAIIDTARQCRLPAATALAQSRHLRRRPRIHVAVTRPEHHNLTAIQVMTHTWQALVFGAVVFVFLVGFCMTAVPHAVEHKWTEQLPVYLTVNEVTLPLTLSYLKVSALLAGVSVLSFAGAYATDKQEGRVEREVHQALCVKYGASRRR